MSIKISNSITSLILSSSVAVLGIGVTSQVTFAQTSHADHHHLMIGIDNLQVLTSGNYEGLANPNYNRLSLLFPHQHEPVINSHFHAIGIYSYIGHPSSPTIVSTSTNNQIPETRYNLPPLSLFPGTGVFEGKKITMKNAPEMYSDLKTKPVAHLEEDKGDPYVDAILNTGGRRWTDLLGDDRRVGLKLISITPGLGVANSSGADLFSSGDTYFIGQGDHFTFTPIFYTSVSAPIQKYSATFQLVDLDDPNGEFSSGEFTLNFQPTLNVQAAQTTPEPSTLLGFGVLGFLMLAKSYKSRKK